MPVCHTQIGSATLPFPIVAHQRIDMHRTRIDVVIDALAAACACRPPATAFVHVALGDGVPDLDTLVPITEIAQV
jgi:hypothetical protein